MELVAPDRRILKAFYTQYVAVLLIILTFTIGAFRRTLTPLSEAGAAALNTTQSQESTVVPVWHPRETVGSMVLVDLFSPDGAVNSSSPQLAAIANVLYNHDLNIRATYQVSRLEFDSDSASLKRAFQRLGSLRTFLRNVGIPDEAMMLVVRPASSGVDTAQIEFFESGEGK